MRDLRVNSGVSGRPVGALGVLAFLALWHSVPECQAKERVLRCRFELLNRTALASSAKLSFAVPDHAKLEFQQRDASAKTEGGICRVHIPVIPPGGAYALMAEIVLSPGQQSAPANEYLQPSDLVECGDPALVAAATALRADSPANTARVISTWIHREIRYAGFRSAIAGAATAFATRSGDCSDMACLLAAMCRAVGIPARVMGGYVVGQDSVLRPHMYHNWAEFFDGTAWRVADPQRNAFMENEDSYIAFEVCDGSRDWSRFKVEGDGITARMF